MTVSCGLTNARLSSIACARAAARRPALHGAAARASVGPSSRRRRPRGNRIRLADRLPGQQGTVVASDSQHATRESYIGGRFAGRRFRRVGDRGGRLRQPEIERLQAHRTLRSARGLRLRRRAHLRRPRRKHHPERAYLDQIQIPQLWHLRRQPRLARRGTPLAGYRCRCPGSRRGFIHGHRAASHTSWSAM